MRNSGIIVYVYRRSPLAVPDIMTALGWRERTVERKEDVNRGYFYETVVSDIYYDTHNECEVLEKNVIKFIPD